MNTLFIGTILNKLHIFGTETFDSAWDKRLKYDDNEKICLFSYLTCLAWAFSCQCHRVIGSLFADNVDVVFRYCCFFLMVWGCGHFDAQIFLPLLPELKQNNDTSLFKKKRRRRRRKSIYRK